MKTVAFWLVIFTASFFAVASNADDSAIAQKLLGKAATQPGLAVHVGCGRVQTPALTAELARQSRHLVHGLALSEADCARARAAVESLGVAGRAQIESIELKPLPHLNDTANLVVVEDFAAIAAQCVSREELIRILAPGGTLCILENGQWTSQVKPHPKEMDEWSHPQHGADANMVSEDRMVRFPLGLRWLDGIPLNLNRWAACRGWIVAGGRLFTLGANEYENLSDAKKPSYLAAHDAFNGLPLWKINTETFDDGAGLRWENVAPIAADETQVYAPLKDKAVILDAATGKILHTLPTQFPTARLLLADGVVVVAGWEDREHSKAKFDRDSLWATWTAKTSFGAVEAFDAKTGAAKWSHPLAAVKIAAADGVVYLLAQVGNPPTERQLVAVDLKTGKKKWQVASSQFGPEADFDLNCAGPGYVVVARRKAEAVLVLSAQDGKLLWKAEQTKSHWTPVVDGQLWIGNKKHDPLTGKVVGAIASHIGGQGCTPSVIVNNIITQSRGCGYCELPASESEPKAKSIRYTGARGACLEGMVPANGMFYTAQNWCRCAPGQVYGFVAVGPSGDWPTSEEMSQPRKSVRGPAFGKIAKSETCANDWPTLRHDPSRGAATKMPVPDSFAVAWKTQAASPADGPLTNAWRSRLGSCLSAPVVSGQIAVVARTDASQIAAFDAATGKPLWSVTLGGRIDSPPTIADGCCYAGCHDGWVYAFRLADGQLVWRTRVAPWERRMVAFGSVESVWPVVGSVVVHDGSVYANAGRTSESDGGIALVSLDAATGALRWAKNIAPGAVRMNDLLRLDAGSIQWHHLSLDAKTGEGDLKLAGGGKKDGSQGGILDGSWTQVGDRRAGKAFQFGKAVANLMAWNDAMFVGPSFAVTKEKAFAEDPEPAAKPDAKKPPKPPTLQPQDYLWRFPPSKTCQVEAIALAGNAVVYAGRNTETPAKPTGFLWIQSLTDGKRQFELALDAPPTYDGLALANGRIFLSLQNGELICLEKK